MELLCGGPHNLGGLYLLPEVRAERFAGFHAVRAELKDAYRRLIAATKAGDALDADEIDVRTDLVFGLIEGVILVRRSGPEGSASRFARATADAALRFPQVLEAAGLAGIPARTVTDQVLAAMSDTVTPQGLLAVCALVDVPLATVVDATALGFETVFVSAGRRGLQVELSPPDLVAVTGAQVAAINAP